MHRWHRALWNVTCLQNELDEDEFPCFPMLQISKFGNLINLQISHIRIRAARLLFNGIERHALALHRLTKALKYAKKLKTKIIDLANTNRLRVTHDVVTRRGISTARAHFSIGAIYVQIVAQAEAIFDDWMERFQVLVHRILRDINDHWMQIDVKAVFRTLSWDVPDIQWALVVNSLEDGNHTVPAWLQ